MLSVIVCALFFYSQQNPRNDATAVGSAFEKNSTTTVAVPEPLKESEPATQAVSADLRSYTNRAYHFYIEFPKGLVGHEYAEHDGAMSVTFQNPETNAGFQVYVTPYAGKQIDDARFKLDNPSGVRIDPTPVVVDGVTATMFFSKNVIGDTREVWFIHDGYLYEVTSYKELDAWLAEIMRSWKFI